MVSAPLVLVYHGMGAGSFPELSEIEKKGVDRGEWDVV
jgi:hypothetical protein